LKKKKNDIETVWSIKFMRIFILPCLLAFSVCGLAQKQANVWYFGVKTGLDFNYDPPKLLSNGFNVEISDLESTSVISDENGTLLFYTDGATVWNKAHQVMPNGTGLYGKSTSTQSLIVKKPRSNSLFYIFTTSPQGNNINYPSEEKGFRYSLVDLTKDDGLGDVVEKNVLLISSTTEKIAGTLHANGVDVWVVMHEWGNRNFRSYLVTENGVILSPTISQAGIAHADGNGEDDENAIGQMKFSPDGENIALALYHETVGELFHFDKSSGNIKLQASLQDFVKKFNSFGLYGVEFSPNSRYLYLTDGRCRLFQYNIASRNVIAFENVFSCSSSGQLGQLQLGPNGKIYMIKWGEFALGIIHSPNEEGSNINFDNMGIIIPTDEGLFTGLGLPNFISSYFYNPELYPPRPYFEMPNVFTPNNDGVNEKFVPMKKYNVASFYIQIYNRWGEQVFETTDIDNGWDGGDASSGVYYWFATYTGINEKTYTQKGYVHLLRN
jgi:gliding motility-associated-like protein